MYYWVIIILLAILSPYACRGIIHESLKIALPVCHNNENKFPSNFILLAEKIYYWRQASFFVSKLNTFCRGTCHTTMNLGFHELEGTVGPVNITEIYSLSPCPLAVFSGNWGMIRSHHRILVPNIDMKTLKKSAGDDTDSILWQFPLTLASDEAVFSASTVAKWLHWYFLKGKRVFLGIINGSSLEGYQKDIFLFTFSA